MKTFVDSTIHIQKNKAETLEDLLKLTKELFLEKAYVYVVMDYAVAFGVYKGGQFTLGVGEREVTEGLPWEYIQELRVFNEEKEMCLFRQGSILTGRTLLEVELEEIQNGISVVRAEEIQKLWGSLSIKNHSGWYVLTSARGTRIQIPVFYQEELQEIKIGTEIGLKVCRYFQTNIATGNISLKDVRITGFCVWDENL